jgi:hypothetical protein
MLLLIDVHDALTMYMYGTKNESPFTYANNISIYAHKDVVHAVSTMKKQLI